MPKLPVVSARDVISALERLGFVKVRQRGSHVVMRRGDKGCAVPMHREVKKGTLAEIPRQSDVSLDAFVEALR